MSRFHKWLCAGMAAVTIGIGALAHANPPAPARVPAPGRTPAMPRPTPLLRGADFLGTQRVQVASVPVQRYYVYYRADAWRYWIPYGPYTRLADAQAAASSFQAAGYESFVR